jgi:hypothetical protein
MKNKDTKLIMEAYSSKKLNEDINTDFGNLGDDVEGKPVEMGHMVTIPNSPNPDQQYIVWGSTMPVAISDRGEDPTVDIVKLGSAATISPKRLLVIGEIGG